MKAADDGQSFTKKDSLIVDRRLLSLMAYGIRNWENSVGDRQRRRTRFLAAHPYCCFCGGSVHATTEDHLPARSLFFRRNWPEGYVFPACHSCNLSSSDDELFMGFLVRITVKPVNEEQRNERQKAIAGIKTRYPDFFAKVQKVSRVEARRRAQAIGGLDQLGVEPTSVFMAIFPPKAVEVSTQYGKKLGKALYYFHTGNILPTDGETFALVMTNAVSPAERVNDFATPCVINLLCKVVLFQSISFALVVG